VAMRSKVTRRQRQSPRSIEPGPSLQSVQLRCLQRSPAACAEASHNSALLLHPGESKATCRPAPERSRHVRLRPATGCVRINDSAPSANSSALTLSNN
jgi:hypothetical protein